MVHLVDKSKCAGSSVYIDVCPNGSIIMICNKLGILCCSINNTGLNDELCRKTWPI